MAPFNKRQIGYIQAIAGRQQHRSLISGLRNDVLTSDGTYSAAETSPRLHGSFVNGSGAGGAAANVKSLLVHTYALDSGASLAFDSKNVHNDSKLTADDFTGLQESHLGQGKYQFLSAFNAPVKGSYKLGNQTTTTTTVGDHGGHDHTVPNVPTTVDASGELVRNPELIPSIYRATEDGFLNSTNISFRFTLPGKLTAGYGAASAHPSTDAPLGQDHYEFRWIVWRHKMPTINKGAHTEEGFSNLEAIRDGASFRNPGYDFFMGQTGRKRGLVGYTLNKDLDKEKITDNPDGEAYSGPRWSGSAFDTNLVTHTLTEPANEGAFTVDDLLTMRINKDDYVVMKDVRFFLGKEHGKSHFEDTLHWDWNDPIDTPNDNVLSSPTLNNKNYRWNMTLIGTTNGANRVMLNSHVRWTTKMESG